MPPKMKTETGNVKVMVRVRPFSKREKAYCEERGQELRPIIAADDTRIAVLDPEAGYQEKDAFQYDEVFWSVNGFDSPNPWADQGDVYEKTGKVMLASALDGYNCCIFAYGQTGSGKTHTMLGSPDSRGVSYLLIQDLFRHIEAEKAADHGTLCTVEVSFMEIYNEQVRDLFNSKSKEGEYSPIKIRQDPVKGILVQGLIQVQVKNAAECAKEMEKGVNERALAETKMNATSSRSHAICQISILQANSRTGLRRNALINLVDLAGSERLKMSGVEGAAAKEAKNINLSLSTLRKVFDTLIANSKQKNPARHQVAPYRESMLTWVLKESLGGNSKTMMIAAISPHEENTEDTMSTLRYALKAKSIVCKVICNEQPSQKMVETLKDQVEELKRQLLDQSSAGLSAEERVEMTKKFEDDIQESQKALEEAMKVEQEMTEAKKELEAEVVKLEEEQHDLRHDLGNQRRQKFSAAFRSAFLIKKDKGELRRVRADLGAAQDDARSLHARIRTLEHAACDAQARASEAEAARRRDVETAQRTLEAHRARAAAADVELLEAQGARREAEAAAAALQRHADRREQAEAALQAEVRRLAAENATLRRAAAAHEAGAGQELAELRKERDELLRKKNAYKKQCAGLQASLEADEVAMRRLREERARGQDGGAAAAMAAEKAASLAVEKMVEKVRQASPSGPVVAAAAASSGADESVGSLLRNLQEFKDTSAGFATAATALRAASGSPAAVASPGAPGAWQTAAASPSPARQRLASLSPTRVANRTAASQSPQARFHARR